MALPMPVVVLDTDVLVAAMLRAAGAARGALRACLGGRWQPVVGPALLSEYEDVLGRSTLFASNVPTPQQRDELLEALLGRCRWVEVFYAWRPNLPDEADHHLIELAMAAQADVIVSRDLRDLQADGGRFPRLRVMTPEACLEAFPCPR